MIMTVIAYASEEKWAALEKAPRRPQQVEPSEIEILISRLFW